MKNYTRFLMILCLIYVGICNALKAQDAPIVPLGDKTLGGNSHDEPRSIAILANGDRVVGGYSSSNVFNEKSENSRGGFDYWIVKTDAQNNKIWDKTFGGNQDDLFNTILALPDGGFLLGGYSFSGISGEKTQAIRGGFDYWVIRIDAEGNKIWDRAFGGSNDDLLTNILALPDGNFLLGGYSRSDISDEKSQSSRGSADYWIVKIDIQGNKIWDKTLGGTAFETMNTMILLSDGGFLLGGTSYSNASGEKSENRRGSFGADFWIIQTDAQGNKVWDKTLGGDGEDFLNSVIALADGSGYFLGGSSQSNILAEKSENNRGGWDNWLIRVDNQGNKIWDQTFGGTSDDILLRLILLADNNCLVTGHSRSNAAFEKSENRRGGYDFWILKVNLDGDLLWNKTLGGNGDEVMGRPILLPDNSVLLAGRSGSGISGEKTESNRGESDYWFYNFSEIESNEDLSAILVDALTDKPIRILNAGDTIDVTQIGTDFLTVELKAKFVDQVESVDVKLEGPINFQKTENLVPFMLFGKNTLTDFRGKNFSPGQYTLTAKPYSEDQLQGISGKTLQLPFTVIGEVPSPVVRFVLVNAETEQDIQVLNPGDIIDMDQAGTDRLSIRAETQGSKVGSVFMELTSVKLNHTQIENLAPYALFGGEPSTNYYGREFCPGNYTIKATPYLNANKTGSLGRSLTLNFQLKGSKLGVENFTLVNPSTDMDISQLEDNAKIQIPSEGIAIRVNAGSCVESVFFNLKNGSGQLLFTRLENLEPYAFVGDDTYGDYFSWNPQPGIYTLEAIPYSEDNAKGVAGLTKTIRFEILAPNASSQLESSTVMSLYPNPSSQDEVHLSLDMHWTGKAQLIVRDKQGNVILSRSISDQEIDLNTQTLKPGYYLIEVQTAEGVFRKPLIKN